MRKIIGYVKDKNNWMFLFVSSIVALLTSLIISLTVYELQTLFEASKKQSEYLEKTNKDIKQYFLKKVDLNNKVFMLKMERYRRYQDAVYTVYNDYNTSRSIFDLYVKSINAVEDEVGIISTKHKNDFNTVMQSTELNFIEDDLKIHIAFLELYSNKSLKNYKDKIFKSFQLIDELYKGLFDDIEKSIFDMNNFLYIHRNIDTREKLLKFLVDLPFPKNTKKNIDKIQSENEKVAKEFSYLTRKIIEDINVKLNGDKVDLIPIIVQDKAKSFLKD